MRDRSPCGADRVRAEIDHAIRSLLHQPFMGTRIDGTRAVRRFVTPRYHYKLFHRVTSDGIEVLAVLHARQREFTIP